MGGCTGPTEDPRAFVARKAYFTFKKLDRNRNDKISQQEIQKYFQSYPQASAKIMMRQIDLNSDGVITLHQWLGYWQLVRKAGYKVADITKQLNNIQGGSLTLDFRDIGNYEQDLPRSTIIDQIVQEMKRNPPGKLPFQMEKV